ncbi:MAG: allantoicase [Proteobacteria bacterium]|nr:allantoicase [Pseudomonadota bacterium]
MSNFLDLVDLVSETVGGAVLAASDEFFAPKENLLKASEARWIADKYTDRGKWMDGWETRRRRSPGHDWVIVRLGLAGALRGVVIDTRHFRGNYPDSCSIDVCTLPGNPSTEELLTDGIPWREVLPQSKLDGHAKNKFEIDDPAGINTRVTHLRLNVHPDGGVARLRVHGEVIPDWDYIDFRGGRIDLASIENGGRVLAQSDMFFGSSHNLIMPGPARDMSEGWDTRRRRGPGNDWAIIKLGARGTIDRLEVDTTHFVGNAPGSCSVESCTVPRDRDGDVGFLTSGYCNWKPFLPEVPLQPNSRQFFEQEIVGAEPVTHVRFNIYPDGGVARLRLYGTTQRSAGIRSALARLNASSDEEFETDMLACCGSSAWGQAMAEARPFADVASLVRTADQAWSKLDKFDWLEAFAAHPRIGESKEGGDRSISWSRNEQSGLANASDAELDRLAEANRSYYEQFGYTFIVYASGKSAAKMLSLLRERLDNDADEELKIAAEEQRKITRVRLGKLLRSKSDH